MATYTPTRSPSRSRASIGLDRRRTAAPPNGLEKHGITWYLDFLQRHNFNAIRLLFNHEHILKNDIVAAPQSEQLLFQTRYIDMFVVLAREAPSEACS